MKTSIKLLFIALLFISILGACTKEEVKPKAEGGANAYRDKL